MFRTLALLTVLLCLADPLAATVLLPADFKDIASGSQIIVYGRVVEARAEWTADRSRIETSVTVIPSVVYRGSPSGTITFRIPGGSVGRYKQVTVGSPELLPGDEAVFFLRANGPAIPQVYGLNQGLYRVRVDERTGRRMVILPPVMARGAGAERLSRGARTRQPLPLEVFNAQLRTVLAGPTRGGR
jgi:hypothetical protein